MKWSVHTRVKPAIDIEVELRPETVMICSLQYTSVRPPTHIGVVNELCGWSSHREAKEIEIPVVHAVGAEEPPSENLGGTSVKGSFPRELVNRLHYPHTYLTV